MNDTELQGRWMMAQGWWKLGGSDNIWISPGNIPLSFDVALAMQLYLSRVELIRAWNVQNKDKLIEMGLAMNIEDGQND